MIPITISNTLVQKTSQQFNRLLSFFVYDRKGELGVFVITNTFEFTLDYHGESEKITTCSIYSPLQYAHDSLCDFFTGL